MIRRFLWSLQGKLVVLYLALTIASLSTITYLFYQSSKGILHASVRSHLETIIRNKSETISGWMREREHDVEVLSKNATVSGHVSTLAAVNSGTPGAPRGGARNRNSGSAEASRRSLRSFLRLVRDQYGAYHEIFVIDRDGRVLASTSTAAPRGIHREAMLKSLRLGKRFTSDVHRYRDGPSLTLDIMVPIEPPDGAVIGAIVAKVDLDVVNELTSSMRMLQSGEVYLVNHNGEFITHRDRRRVLRQNISKVPGVNNVIRGRNGVGEYENYRGTRVVGAYHWLPRWRWGLMAEVEQSEALAPVFKARREHFMIAGLVTLVVLLGTFFIGRRIVRPLQELSHAVRAVASGKLDQRLEIAGHDEIAYLTECFNHMAKSLGEYRSAMDEQISRATANLESRTEQLEKANEHLARVNQEIQQANRELEQQRALVAHSARLAAMGEMAAGIAHEINNPLTTMKNLLHTLRTGLSAEDLRRKDMSIIEEEIDKINRLVLNFLRYAQPPKAKIEVLDLKQLARRTLDLLEPQIKQKQLAVRTELADQVPRIQADREQLEQVCLNLLLNAVQASPEQSEIRVGIRPVFADGSGEPRRVELSVADDGPGIRPENRDKIFKPFFTTKSRGSGLGLAISQRIIEEHGGEISFTSGGDGKGTTFSVTFRVGAVEEKDGLDPDRG